MPRAADLGRLNAKVGDDPPSIRDHFRRAGRNRKSFYYRRGRDLDRVAAFLSEQRAGKTPNAVAIPYEETDCL